MKIITSSSPTQNYSRSDRRYESRVYSSELKTCVSLSVYLPRRPWEPSVGQYFREMTKQAIKKGVFHFVSSFILSLNQSF